MEFDTSMKLLFPMEGMDMKKYGFRKLNNGWRFKIGGTSGEPFGITLRYFNICRRSDGSEGLYMVDFNNKQELLPVSVGMPV